MIRGLARRPSDPNLGEMTRTITIYDPLTVTGDLPPGAGTNWWPLIIAGAVLVGLWWITRDEEGGRDRRPFDEETE